jgi:hypothetical protein
MVLTPDSVRGKPNDLRSMRRPLGFSRTLSGINPTYVLGGLNRGCDGRSCRLALSAAKPNDLRSTRRPLGFSRTLSGINQSACSAA